MTTDAVTTDARPPVPSSTFLRVGAWVALTAYALLLVTLTHIPKPPGVFEGHSDKTLHLLAYLTLGVLGYVAAVLQFPKRRGLALWVVLVGTVFAALDESTQPLFGRHADVFDFRTDMIGLIVSVVVLAVARKVIRRLRAT